jgi:hypothetical protein
VRRRRRRRMHFAVFFFGRMYILEEMEIGRNE